MKALDQQTTILKINEFYTETILGVYDWEKQAARPVLINAEIWLETRKAAHSDSLEDTIDYAKLVEQLDAVIRGRSFNLIETVAEVVSDYILSHYPTNHIKVEVIKPGILKNVRQISICIERFR